jgi:hypothetical protein
LNLIKTYRTSKISTRIILLCLVIILGSLISWVNNTNVFVTVGVITGLGILLEGLLVHHRKMITIVILALHFIGLSFYTLTFYTIYSSTVTEDTGIFVAGTIFITGLITTLFAIYLCSKIAYGRFWVNLLISFLLYYVSLTVLVVLFPQVSQLIPAGITFIVVMLYPVSNRLVWRKRAYKFDVEKFPQNKKQTVLANKLPQIFNILQTVTLETNPYIQSYRNNKGILFVLPLTGEKPVEIDGNILKVDEEDTTWVLEYVLQSAREFSRKYNVRQKNLVPVVMVNSINLPRGITPIKVRARNKPDKIIGTVLICKIDKAGLLIKQLDDMSNLNNRELTTLIND